MRDPLSIAPVQLQDTYDPVKLQRQLLLDKELKERERLSSFATDLPKINKWEDPKFMELLQKRNALDKLGIAFYQKGYDLKRGMSKEELEARSQFNTASQNFSSEIQDYNNLNKVYDEANKSLIQDYAKGEKGIFNYEESLKRLNQFKNAPDIKSAKEIFNKFGAAGFLVTKPQKIDLLTEASKTIKEYAPEIETKVPSLDKETGIVTTKEEKGRTEESVRKALRTSLTEGIGIWDDIVRRRTTTDPYFDPDEFSKLSREEQIKSNENWYFENFGKQFVTKQRKEDIRRISGIGEKDKKDFNVIPGTITTDLKTVAEIGKGRLQVQGENAIGFPDKKITVNTGSEAVSITSGVRHPNSELVEFTPITSAEYTYLKKDYFRKNHVVTQEDIDSGLFPQWNEQKKEEMIGKKVHLKYPAGSIVTQKMIENKKFKPEDIGKRRYVEGVGRTIKAETAKEKEYKLLIPYKDVKYKMESSFKGLSDFINKEVSSKVYVLEGYGEFTHDELKQSGWTDEQINNLPTK